MDSTPRKQRTPDQIERDRVEIANRYLQGETQASIGQALGVTQQQISKDLKVIRQRWKESQIGCIDEHISQKLEEIRLVKLEAWRAWESSQEGKRTTSKSTMQSGDTESVKTAIRQETSTGNASHLSQVLECIKQESALLNLPAELKYQDINAAIATVVAAGFVVSDSTAGDE